MGAKLKNWYLGLYHLAQVAWYDGIGQGRWDLLWEDLAEICGLCR